MKHDTICDGFVALLTKRSIIAIPEESIRRVDSMAGGRCVVYTHDDERFVVRQTATDVLTIIGRARMARSVADGVRMRVQMEAASKSIPTPSVPHPVTDQEAN